MEVPLSYVSFCSLIFLVLTLLNNVPETGSAPTSINNTSRADSTNANTSCLFPPKEALELVESCLASSDGNPRGKMKIILCRGIMSLITKICLPENQDLMKSKNVPVPSLKKSVTIDQFCGNFKAEDFKKTVNGDDAELFLESFSSNSTGLGCASLCKSQKQSTETDKISQTCSLFDVSNKLLHRLEKSSQIQSSVSKDSTESEQNALDPISDKKPIPKRSAAQAEAGDDSTAGVSLTKLVPKKQKVSIIGISPKPEVPEENEQEAQQQEEPVKPRTVTKKSEAKDNEDGVEIKVEDPAIPAMSAGDGIEKGTGGNAKVKPAGLGQNQNQDPNSDDNVAGTEKKKNAVTVIKAKGREGVTDNPSQVLAQSDKQEAPEDKPETDKKISEPSQKDDGDVNKKADVDVPKNSKAKPDAGDAEDVLEHPGKDNDDTDTKSEANQNHKSSLAVPVPVRRVKKPVEDKAEESDPNQPAEPAKISNLDVDKDVAPAKTLDRVVDKGSEPAKDLPPSKPSQPTPVARPDTIVAKPSSTQATNLQDNNGFDDAPIPGMSEEGNNKGFGSPDYDDQQDPINNDNNDIPVPAAPVERPPSRFSNSKIPSDRKIPSDSRKVVYSDSPRGGLDNESTSSSFNYFVVFLGIVGLGFLIFLNKKRVIALLIEGRRPRGGGRGRTQSISRTRGGSGSTSYRKLENNFDE